MAYLGNPAYTMAVLEKHGFHFQKKYGQNFLIDKNILEKIVDAAEIGEDDVVLEIGPGIGTMTQYLCERAREVIAVEIDDKLIPVLADTLSEYDNVTVIHEDILKVDIRALAEEKNGGKPIKVVANLPYYITTPIIMELFESRVPLESVTVMVQKEVAERMKEGPGSKALRRPLSGGGLLCRRGDCGGGSARLLCSPAQGVQHGNPSDLSQRAAGGGGGREISLFRNPRLLPAAA